MHGTLAAMAEVILRTDLSELAALAAFVDDFAAAQSLSAEVAFQLNLVLEELVTNTVSYGHPGRAGTIHLRLTRVGDVVEAELVDSGVAFDPRSAPPPDLDAPLAERRVGGLGVHLVRQFVDEIEYRREDGRNHLRLRKRVPTQRADGGDVGRE
jgi:anti-sigma regulatory factor (Ser/Thr protein kinase)